MRGMAPRTLHLDVGQIDTELASNGARVPAALQAVGVGLGEAALRGGRGEAEAPAGAVSVALPEALGPVEPRLDAVLVDAGVLAVAVALGVVHERRIADNDSPVNYPVD